MSCCCQNNCEIWAVMWSTAKRQSCSLSCCSALLKTHFLPTVSKYSWSDDRKWSLSRGCSLLNEPSYWLFLPVTHRRLADLRAADTVCRGTSGRCHIDMNRVWMLWVWIIIFGYSWRTCSVRLLLPTDLQTVCAESHAGYLCNLSSLNYLESPLWSFPAVH